MRDLLGKRAIGLVELLLGRAARFEQERIADVVSQVRGLNPDHVLITGDLTTLALPSEFAQARQALDALLSDPRRVTVLPGNHDRYTPDAVRLRLFERQFGAYGESSAYPWMRSIGPDLDLLALDAARPYWNAQGRIPGTQLAAARVLWSSSKAPRRIVACHYPLDAPQQHRARLRRKRLVNAPEVIDWLRQAGRHIYCCGHVHSAWSIRPKKLPDQLCLNAGAAVMRGDGRHALPGFLVIELEGADVRVDHHAWNGRAWRVFELARELDFFSDQPHTRDTR